jgi:hypothetical protein
VKNSRKLQQIKLINYRRYFDIQMYVPVASCIISIGLLSPELKSGLHSRSIPMYSGSLSSNLLIATGKKLADVTLYTVPSNI